MDFESRCALNEKDVQEATWVSEGQTKQEEQVNEATQTLSLMML